jgi:ribosomal protein S4
MSEEKTSGDRIAKVMARAGIASRRDAERMILEGRVAVNGKAVSSPALDIQPGDQVTLDGKPIDAPQQGFGFITNLWGLSLRTRMKKAARRSSIHCPRICQG